MASRKPALDPALDPVNPHDQVWVRDAAQGAQYPLTRSVAVAEPDRYTVLDKPATWQGVPLPPKPRILTASPASPPHTSDDESVGAADQAADIPVTA